MTAARGVLVAGALGARAPVRVRAAGWTPLMIALAGVILQYVWRIQEVFPELRFVQFTALVSLGAMGAFALAPGSATRVSNLRHDLLRLMIAIFVLAILTVPTSIHQGASVRFLTGNFAKTIVLASILAISIRDRRDVERMLWVLLLGGAAYVVTAIIFASGTGRLGGRGSYDPNDLGLFTVSTVPLCIYFIRRGVKPMHKLVVLGAALVLLYGTVQTGSRGGFLALITVALYALLALPAVRRSRRLTVLGFGVAVIFVVAGDAYWERMSTILHPQEDYNWAGQAESGRIEVWKRGIGYMLRRPLLGVGVDQFIVAEGTMAPQAARQALGIGFRWSAAHNSYIQIGAELGVLGLGLFAAMLFVAFREARWIGRIAPRQSDRLLGQLFGAQVIGYAVGCAFLSQSYATYLYFSLAILIGLSRIVRAEQRLAMSAAGAPFTPPVMTPGARALERGGARRRDARAP